jgi:hypothetical protein
MPLFASFFATLAEDSIFGGYPGTILVYKIAVFQAGFVIIADFK